MKPRRRTVAGLMAVTLLGSATLVGAGLVWPRQDAVFAAAMWQPDCATMGRLPDVSRLGAQRLIVQYLALDETDFTAPRPCPIDVAVARRTSGVERLTLGAQGRRAPTLEDFQTGPHPDTQLWARIRANGGTSLDFDHYAALELHPGVPAALARAYLSALPRPLMVSVYGPPGSYTAALADYVRQAVPPDVKVLLQDGVGVGHATVEQAAAVAGLIARDRPGRLAVIVECFRVRGRAFRPAWPWEIQRQVRALGRWPLVAFDAGHYLTPARVQALLLWRALERT